MLGVDMNGWHAVSGFLVVLPVLMVLVCFPNNETGALLHFGTSLIWLGGAAHYFLARPV